MLKLIINLTIKIINNMETFLIPLTFLLGFFGNLISSMCILTTSKMRKRTPFFILATIGITDTILLFSQLQRWLAIHFDQQFYLVNHSLCKFYLLLVRSSVLLTSGLILSLTVSSVVRLYLGSFKLSTNSKLGQMLSRLCVGYVIALGLSFSWHELWTSGLTNLTIAIHLNDDESQHNDYISLIPLNKPAVYSINSDLKCSKNVDSVLIVNVINYAYFSICILINMFLILNSTLIYLKLKEKFVKFTKLFKAADLSKNNSQLVSNSDFNVNNPVTLYVENMYNNNLILKKKSNGTVSLNNLSTENNFDTVSIYETFIKSEPQFNRLDVKQTESSSANNLNVTKQKTFSIRQNQAIVIPKNSPNNFTRFLIVSCFRYISIKLRDQGLKFYAF